MKVPLELTAFRGEVMGQKNGKNNFFRNAYFWHISYAKKKINPEKKKICFLKAPL